MTVPLMSLMFTSHPITAPQVSYKLQVLTVNRWRVTRIWPRATIYKPRRRALSDRLPREPEGLGAGEMYRDDEKAKNVGRPAPLCGSG